MSWPYDTREWRDRVRPASLERDSYTCQHCGVTADHLPRGASDLLVDHVIPWSLGGAPFDLANTETLCNPCSGRKDGRRAGQNNRSQGMTAIRSQGMTAIR